MNGLCQARRDAAHGWHIWLAALALLALAACAQTQTPLPEGPFLYRPEQVARADHLVLAAPGVMTSVKMFAPLAEWERRGTAVVYYRLPGLDGRPRDGAIDIAASGAEMARFAAAQPRLKRVSFVGFSTGAAMGLEGAAALRAARPDLDIRVAAISTALPMPQPVWAGLRGGGDLVASAVRTRSLDRRTVWLDYYRVLLRGRSAATPAARAAGAQTPDPGAPTDATDALVRSRADSILLPERGLGALHIGGLARWFGPPRDALDHVRLRFFHGQDDPVFPPSAAARYAARLGETQTLVYPGHGHLLIITYPGLFKDLATFLEP